MELGPVAEHDGDACRPCPRPSFVQAGGQGVDAVAQLAQVQLFVAALVRMATRSGTRATVCSSACVIVSPSTGGAEPCSAAVVLLSIPLPSGARTPAQT